MNEVVCPHCKKAFKIDEAGYADILKQVKNDEFNKELHERLSVADKEKESAVKLAEANVRISLQKQLSEKCFRDYRNAEADRGKTNAVAY